jgi:hypothetical protein
MALKPSYDELEKRCVKHQNNEIEAKQQLTSYQVFIVSLYYFSLNLSVIGFK